MLFVITTSATTQCFSNIIDSIKMAIATLPHTDTIWMKGNYAIARDLMYTDLSKSIRMSEIGYAIAKEEKNERFQYLYLYLLGTNFQYNQSYDKSLKCFNEALNLVEKTKDYRRMVDCYTNMANTYNNNSKLDSATQYNLKSIDLAKKYVPNSRWGDNYLNIGLAYYQMKDNENALQYMKLALTDTSLAADDLLYVYGNLCNFYCGIQQKDSAIVYVNLIKEIVAENNMDSPDLLNVAYMSYVEYDFLAKPNLRTKSTIQKLINVALQLQDSTKIANAYKQLSNYYHYFGQHDSSSAAMKMAVKFALNSGDLNSKISLYDRLSEDALAMHKPEEAFQYANISRKLVDSFYIIQNAEAVRNAQIKFETKEKEEKNKLLLHENELKTRQKNLILFGGMALASVLSLFLWSNFRSRKKTELLNKKIEDQNIALAESNQTKDKIFRIISHDLRAPISGLSGLVMLKESGVVLSDEKQQELDNKIKTALRNTSSSLDNLLIWSIGQMKQEKVTMQEFELNELLQSQINLLQPQCEAKHININFATTENYQVATDKNSLEVIVRNILSNAIKFSYPKSNINIRILIDSNKKLQIIIQDYGIGMSSEQIEKYTQGNLQSTKGTASEMGTGLGFLLIKDYCDKLNIQLEIKSEKEKGSIFFLTL